MYTNEKRFHFLPNYFDVCLWLQSSVTMSSKWLLDLFYFSFKISKLETSTCSFYLINVYWISSHSKANFGLRPWTYHCKYW